MNRLLLSATVVGLMAGLSLGADLKSGLQAGESVSPFHVLNITGKQAGKSACLV